MIVSTNGEAKILEIPPRSDAPGSSVNGAELLFVAIATCYCNDIYREAPKRNIKVDSVEVTVNGEFGQAGSAAKFINYNVKISSPNTDDDVEELIQYVDEIAEVHNTLRKGISVVLDKSHNLSM